MNMKKYYTSCLSFLIVSILLVSCKGDIPINEMLVCGSYGVPGMICYDAKGEGYSCDILEKDQFGRILYTYTTENLITGREETALVLCQGYDAEYVYFYEDLCYLLSDYDEKKTQELKERNDWDKPLDYTKASRRAINISFDLVLITETDINANSLRSACARKLGIREKEVADLCILDADGSGHALYWLSTEVDGIEATYLVIANSGYGISLLALDNTELTASEISAFKQASAWVYGF